MIQSFSPRDYEFATNALKKAFGEFTAHLGKDEQIFLIGRRAVAVARYDRATHVGHLLFTWVAPRHRKRGLHKTLILERIQWLHQQGAKKIVCCSASAQTTRTLTRLGFTRAGSGLLVLQWRDKPGEKSHG